MLELPDTNSIPLAADWVELMLSVNGGSISRASIASDIESSTGREPGEAEIGDVWSELAYRQSLYSRCPFSVRDRTVESPPELEQSVEYQACLLLSLYGVRGRSSTPTKLFERLVSEALSTYLSGKAQVFGWPFGPEAYPEDGEETRISRKVKAITLALNERFCEAPAGRFKDRGLDIAGWKPFADGRSSQLVVFLQCAAGHNWRDKHSVPIKRWSQYIHWACEPIVAFAVPCVISDNLWHDESTDKGLLFDRIRIANLLPQGVQDEALKRDLTAWVNRELSALAE
jgi:hypothetical protein